jgi:hypothetical protein
LAARFQSLIDAGLAALWPFREIDGEQTRNISFSDPLDLVIIGTL